MNCLRRFESRVNDSLFKATSSNLHHRISNQTNPTADGRMRSCGRIDKLEIERHFALLRVVDPLSSFHAVRITHWNRYLCWYLLRQILTILYCFYSEFLSPASIVFMPWNVKCYDHDISLPMKCDHSWLNPSVFRTLVGEVKNSRGRAD